MTKPINDEISISIPCETERVSGKMEDIRKTNGKSATIIRDRKRRTLAGTVVGCLHGRFKEHVSSRSRREGSFTRLLLWITVTVCMTILTAYQVSNVIQYLGQQQAIVHSEMKNQKSVPFPAVTICSQEPFQKNKITDYYTLLTSTTSMKAIKDFDAIWAIYYLETVLKLHGKQPSCEDSLSKVSCSLNPTQSCEGQEDSLYPWNSNLRKLQRQRSLENNVTPNIDNVIPDIDNVTPDIDNVIPDIDNVMTSPCSDFVWNSWLPGMINSGEESDIMKLTLIKACLLRYNDDRHAMSLSSKYYQTHFLSLWADSRSYLNSGDWWVGSSIINYGSDFSYWSEDDSLRLPGSRGFLLNAIGGVVNNVVDWWHGEPDSSSESIGILTNIWYLANSIINSVFNWNDDSSDSAGDWSLMDKIWSAFDGFMSWLLESDNTEYASHPGFYYIMTCIHDPDCYEDFSFYEYIGISGVKDYLGTIQTMYGKTYIDWGSANPTSFLWDYHGHPESRDQYPSLWWLFDIFPLHDTHAADTYDTTFFIGEATLQILYSHFPDYTHDELVNIWQAYSAISQFTELYHSVQMLYSYNVLGEDTLPILHSYNALGADTLPILYSYSELGEDTLPILYSYNALGEDTLLMLYSYSALGEDTLPILYSYSALGEDILQKLYSYFPGYTYKELVDMRQVYSGIAPYSGLYLSDYDVYHTLLLYSGNSEYSKEELTANLFIYRSYFPFTYSIYYSSLSDISFYRLFSSYRSTPSSLNSFSESLSDMNEQGYFSQNRFSPLGKEMDMLNILLSKSQPVDPKDLMQWSSINTKLIEQLGFTYSEMISECSYNGEDCDFRDFTVRKNDRYGNCFTFNSELNGKTKAREAEKPGKQNGLKLVLNTMEKGHPGFRLSIHHSMEVPIPEENGIDISTEETSIMSTSVQINERLQEPQGSCKEMNWALEGSQTLDGCKTMCHEEMIRLNCRCKKTMLPMNADTEERLPQCGFNNMKCLLDIANRYNGESCSHCLAPCHEVTYNTEIVRIEKQRANDKCTDRLTVKPNEDRSTNPSIIHVYMETLQINNLTEKLPYTLQDMIKDTGVWMYLFLGVSMLSLLEFILELLILLVSKRNNATKDVYEEKAVTIKCQQEDF